MSPRAHLHEVSHFLKNTYCLARDEQTKNSGSRKGLCCLKKGERLWDISGSPGALLASHSALLSAPVGGLWLVGGESWAAGWEERAWK